MQKIIKTAVGTAIVTLGVTSCVSLDEAHHKAATAMYERAKQQIKPHHIKQCERKLASYSGFGESGILPALTTSVGNFGNAKWKMTGPLVPNKKLTCYYAAVGKYGFKVNKNTSVAYYSAPVKRVSGWRGTNTPQTSKGDFYWCRFVVDKGAVKIDGAGVGVSVQSGYQSSYAADCGLSLGR